MEDIREVSEDVYKRQPFDRAKILRGMRSAAKNRPVDEESLEALEMCIRDSWRPAATSAAIAR